MAGHNRDTAEVLLCPSAPATVGALIIGVVRADGSVGFIRDRIPVNAEFIKAADSGRAPEQRFRFSSPCQECACQQWADGRCSLPGRIAEAVPNSLTPEALPRCSIRHDCRWYHQLGADACRVCPLVVTRNGSEATSNT